MNTNFTMKGLTQHLVLHEDGCTTRTAVDVPATAEGLAEAIQAAGFLDAAAVCWQIHRLTFAAVRDGKLQCPDGNALRPELLLEARIFNDAAELHVKKQGNRLRGRVLTDDAKTPTEPTDYVDSLARLWGKRAGDAPADWLTLKDDDRKLALTIPAPEDTSATYYGLVTRSYVGVHPETAQAGYTDMRYVAIVPADADDARKENA